MASGNDQYGRAEPTAGERSAVHYDETVQKSLGDKDASYWGGVLLVLGILGVLIWIGVQDGSMVMVGVGVAGIAFVPVMLYTTFKQGLRVRVTDAGVDVQPTGHLAWRVPGRSRFRNTPTSSSSVTS